jgi:regulator of RNase E activity RraA
MDAVIVVPMEVAEQVMIRAEEMRKTEDAVREELKSGASFKNVWDKYERL